MLAYHLEGSSYLFFLGGSVTTLYLWAEGVWCSIQPEEASKEVQAVTRSISIQPVNPISGPFSNMNSVPCGYNLLSDITIRLHCAVWASMTLRASGERKGSKSTVVINLSLHQTNRRALDLQNNQQPGKRFEQTPAGCHSEEQMTFLKK